MRAISRLTKIHFKDFEVKYKNKKKDCYSQQPPNNSPNSLVGGKQSNPVGTYAVNLAEKKLTFTTLSNIVYHWVANINANDKFGS